MGNLKLGKVEEQSIKIKIFLDYMLIKIIGEEDISERSLRSRIPQARYINVILEN